MNFKKLSKLCLVTFLFITFATHEKIKVLALDCVSIEFGSGTLEDPFIIRNSMELYSIRCDLNKHYKLGNDIEFFEEDFVEGGQFFLDEMGGFFQPIGVSLHTGMNNQPFRGVFDGDDFKIINPVLKPYGDYSGIFYINEGTIKNVEITNAEANPNLYNNLSIGSLVGLNRGIVNNASNNSDFENINSPFLGGLVGENDENGIIISSYNYGKLSGVNVGGLVGKNSGIITESSNYGIISGSRAGGIVALNEGEISSSSNEADIFGSKYLYFEYKNGAMSMPEVLFNPEIHTNYNFVSSHFGGTLGGITAINGEFEFQNGKIINNTNNGTINAFHDTSNFQIDSISGGMIGINYGEIDQATNSGEIIALEAAGVAGINYGNMTNITNFGTISGYTSGGISGRN